MSVAMLLHKSVVHDSRVRREAATLAAAGHPVTVIELARDAAGTLDGFARRSATPRVRRPRALYRLAFVVRFIRQARRLHPDVVHAHDAAMLLPGLLAARLTHARLIYDSHELATGVAYRDGLYARFVATVEALSIRRAAAVITVSDGIAEALQQRYRLPARPVVLRNVTALQRRGEHGALRARLSLAPDVPLVLHQGAAAPDRGCEQLLAAVAQLPEAHLCFLGGSDPPGYDAQLRALAQEHGVAGRVHFVPSVPLERLLDHTAGADVGVTLLQDVSENHRLALPNKLFEYIAAGVPVVCSDLPEQRRLVSDLGVGWPVDAADPQAIAAGIRTALAARGDSGLRERLAAAAEELSWERERARLLELYAGLAGAPVGVQLVRNAVRHDARVLRAAHVMADIGLAPQIVGVVAGGDRRTELVLDGVRVRRLDPSSPLGALRRRLRGGTPSGATTSPATGAAPAGRPSATVRLARTLTTLDYHRRGIALLRRLRPAVVHANDHNTMALALAAKLLCGARVVYDSHELWADRNGRPEWRPRLVAQEALYVRAADAVITTSPGYAAELARRYRVAAPAVIRNIPAERTATSPAAPRPELAYIGGLMPGRGLEQAIDALALVPDLTLRCIGPGADGYRSGLLARAARRGVADRVRLEPPVPPADVVGAIAGAVAGLLLIQPVCRSYELTLPNKLFEYAAAGLPMLASDLPVLGAVVAEHGLGAVVAPDDIDAIAAALVRLTTDDPALRERVAAFAARETWAAERERLAAVYRFSPRCSRA